MDTIEEELDSRLGAYYLQRVRIHMDDCYAGIRMRKFPEDLRVLEEVLWLGPVDTVLEVGTGHGGSALWLRDRLRTLAAYGHIDRPLVVTVDVDSSLARGHLQQVDPDYAETIKLVEADIRDPAVIAVVHRHLAHDSRVLVIDDSAHTYETTMATLRHFSPLVPLHGYILVEDGHRDLSGMLPSEVPGRAHGVLRAIRDWLSTVEGLRFTQRRDLERYIVTSNPGGWLQRVRQ